jgi:hypothetical protein
MGNWESTASGSHVIRGGVVRGTRLAAASGWFRVNITRRAGLGEQPARHEGRKFHQSPFPTVGVIVVCAPRWYRHLEANTVSGIICQEKGSSSITMTLEHHLDYHSHYATMWG